VSRQCLLIEPLESRMLLAVAPVGPEFLVNSTTAGDQREPKVAMEAAGDFVVVWESPSPNNAFINGVYAQRYNAAGVAQGSEFPVRATTGDADRPYPNAPDVAMDAAGDFVVVWQEYDNSFNFCGVSGIYAQRYNAAGVAQGSDFHVNTTTECDQLFPSVAMDAVGNFVVSWQSYRRNGGFGIYAQQYNALGEAQGSETLVSTTDLYDNERPSVAMDPAGDFVVSWQGNDRGYYDTVDNYNIYAQRYNATGVAQGNEFPVNSTTVDTQAFSSVAMDAVGNFVVSWHSNLQDGNGFGIYAQRYNAAGVAQGGEFPVNTITSGNQTRPAVAMNAAGDFVISLQSSDGSSFGIYAQAFNAGGAAQGSEFRVNTTTANRQDHPSVKMDAAGDIVVCWESNLQDGSGYGIYAQRYGVNKTPTTTGISNVTINSGDPDTLVDLFSAFADDKDADDKLIYTLAGNTNPSLFTSTAIDSASGKLTLAYAPNAIGSSDLTLRATDTGGLFVETTFTVTIQPPVASPLVVNGTDANDTIVLKQSGTNVMVWINHDPASDPADITRTLASITSISINGGLGDDTFALDFAAGDPIPSGGLNIDGGGGVDTLNFINTGGPGRASAASVSGSLNITGGAVNVASDGNGLSLTASNVATVNFSTSQHLAALTLADNAKAALAAAGDHFIRTNALSIAPTATLDLVDNDLILQSTAANRSADLATVAGLIKSSRNGGVWNGQGIISSAAAAEPNKLTGLAVAVNDKSGGLTLYSAFDGEIVDANSILVKYTYNGDADLSGKIDSDDYFRIDSGFASKLSGYRDGDFDFNGVVDSDDYFLIDRAFVGQTGVLAAVQPVHVASHHRHRLRHHRLRAVQ
jgi:hypothetical protein